jgi:hypothetical protein
MFSTQRKKERKKVRNDNYRCGGREVKPLPSGEVHVKNIAEEKSFNMKIKGTFSLSLDLVL